MSTLEIHDGQMEFVVTLDDGIPLHDDQRVAAIIAAARAMNARVPLAKVEVTRQPDHYTYLITAKDGRTWPQTFHFAPSESEPSQTFSVTDKWKLSEFQPGRALRREIVALLMDFDVQTMKIEWMI